MSDGICSAEQAIQEGQAADSGISVGAGLKAFGGTLCFWVVSKKQQAF